MTSFFTEEQKIEKYTGYKKVKMKESELIEFYNNLNVNKYNLLIICLYIKVLLFDYYYIS